MSNKVLLFLIAVAISLSMLTSFYTLENLGSLTQKPVGKATTDAGRVTVTILSTISITMANDTVYFGAGYVNRSTCTTNATLHAGQTYNDSEGTDCWSDNSAMPTSLILMNDGATNASITVRGPTNSSLFNNYNGTDPYGVAWKARNHESNSCPGVTFQTSYTDFNDSIKQVCSDMYFASANNSLGLDIRIVIPANNLSAGTYSNSSIIFTATAS